MRVLILLALGLGTMGCGASQQAQLIDEHEKRMAQRAIDEEECKARYPVAPRKNNVARARCLNEATDRAMRPTGQDIDLLNLFAAKRIAIATQIDDGKISQVEGEAQIAQAWSDILSERDRRVAGRQSAAAQQQAAAAQQQAAGAATMTAIRANAPRTCTLVGNVMQCF